MKFIRSSYLNLTEKNIMQNILLNYRDINKGLKNLSTVISSAKDLCSFTIHLDLDDDIQKKELYELFKKLNNLKKISSINIRLSGETINMTELKHSLKAQKNLSKLYLSYFGISILKKGFISLSKNLGSCQNLSDLRVYLGSSFEILP